jgi:hypothetical protein
MIHVKVVEGPIPGSPAEPAKLQAVLIDYRLAGFATIVLPNGLNRWTVIAEKTDG